MNASDFKGEAGAPYITVLDDNSRPLTLRLCVLQGSSVNGGAIEKFHSLLIK